MTRHRNSDPLQGHRVPAPPAQLERRVLDAATTALRDGPRTVLWNRLWASRPLRLAWALAVIGLLGAHAAMSLGLPDPPSNTSRLTDRTPSSELREELALPMVEISPRAEALAMGRRSRTPTPESDPSDSTDKNEVPS
jgi:hypothetical protein